MIDAKDKIFAALKDGIGDNLKEKINAGLESGLDLAGLVSREEFERLQKSVITNREMIQALEQKVSALEAQLAKQD